MGQDKEECTKCIYKKNIIFAVMTNIRPSAHTLSATAIAFGLWSEYEPMNVCDSKRNENSV